MKTAILTFVATAALASTAYAAELGSVDCSESSISLQFTNDVSVSGANITGISVGSSADVSGHTALSSSSSISSTGSNSAMISLSASDQAANSAALTGGGCFVTISASAIEGVGAASVPE